MIKLVIFDFDGTMFDTAPEIHGAINLTLTDLNKPTLKYEEVKHSIGHGLFHLIDHMKIDLDKSPQGYMNIIKLFRAHYEGLFMDSKPYPGLYEFLNQNKYLFAVASNKDESYVKRYLDQKPWQSVNWVATHGGNTFKTKKPDPEIILDILAKSGCSSQDTVIVGDGQPDVDVAKNVGIKCIAAEYGYSSKKELESWGVEYKISNLFELENQIQNL
jgi:phosphoglycolate phosphatase